MEDSMNICGNASGDNNDNTQKESADIIIKEEPLLLTLSDEESVEDETIAQHLTDVEISMKEGEDKCHGITLEQEYMELFPKGTHICKMSCKINHFKEAEMVGEFKLKISTKEDFKTWLLLFQNLTLTTYILRSTIPRKGKKILYKGFYNCQHHAGGNKKNIYQNKSTDCKARMKVTIARNPEGYRCRNKNRHKHPSEMQTTVHLNFNHNHGINRAEALKHRKPTKEVVKILESAFQNGMTPGIALKKLKINLKEEYGESYHNVVADRAICPDIGFVYHLFKKYSRKKSGITDAALEEPNVARKTRKKSTKPTRAIAKTAIEMVSNTLYRIQGGGTSTYFVDTDIGTCTCQAASLNNLFDPCLHQAAVANYYPETDQLHLFNTEVPLVASAIGNQLHKKKCCGKCEGCISPDCKNCKHCLDKIKYGGKGTLKQRCELKKCLNPNVTIKITKDKNGVESSQELRNPEFLLPLTAEPPETAEPFKHIKLIKPITQENENELEPNLEDSEEDSDFDARQEDDEPEPNLEDNYARIKAAEEDIEKALASLKRKLCRALHDDVTTLSPVLKKFEQNINSVETQSQLVSSMSTFGKNVESTSATAIERNRKDTNK